MSGDVVKWMGFVVYGIYVLSTLWLFLNACIQLHLLRHSRKKKSASTEKLLQLPFVTIQVPIYNEKYVVDELLASLANLEYPKHLYEIQVLDDSTDETSDIIDKKATQLSGEGIAISVLRRGNRDGYKAGALQYGLAFCKGEFIAIFDADFRPSTRFLYQMLPHFNQSNVGLVQARWGHLNREQNFLTRIQTYLLDMHFTIEQAGRYNAGYFINFCGTAGIWRKQCIEDAGGWDGTVLSEDLDLSYRAQLRGWTIIYDKDIEVPAQLPAVVEAFKIQQFRWTKGIAQIARKTLPQVWRMPIPFSKKLHSIFHLLGSFTFVCLFINALLTIPLLLLRHRFPEFVQLTNYTAVGVLNLFAITYLYYKGSALSPKNRLGFFIYYPVFLVVYLAMSVQNAIAVWQGLAGSKSVFIRTPKFSEHSSPVNSYISKKTNWISVLEIVLLGYFIYGIGLSIYFGDYFLLMFFGLMVWGLGILIYQSMPRFHLKQIFRPGIAPGQTLNQA